MKRKMCKEYIYIMLIYRDRTRKNKVDDVKMMKAGTGNEAHRYIQYPNINGRNT